MDTLIFLLLLATLGWIAYLWGFDKVGWQDEDALDNLITDDVTTRVTDYQFSLSTTSYCDTGDEFSSALDLLPNAEFRACTTPNPDFVRITIIPIKGAAPVSTIITRKTLDTLKALDKVK